MRPKQRPPQRQRHRNIGLTADEITALLAALRSHRDDAMIRLALSVGLRVSEVITLTQSDIDWERGTIRVWDEKKDAMREVTPDSRTLTILRMYVTSIGQRRDLFPISTKTCNRIVQAASGQALGRVISWHSLRTTYVSRCREEGVPLEIVQRNTGDSLRTLFRHYSRMPDSVVRKLVDANTVIPEGA